jgi:hypothetical protein
MMVLGISFNYNYQYYLRLFYFFLYGFIQIVKYYFKKTVDTTLTCLKFPEIRWHMTDRLDPIRRL